jgi:DnaJ family protein A protein 2
MSDLYECLGVNRSASLEEIRSAYKSRALIHHPDRGGNEEEFKKIQEAHEVLSDEGRRRHYDMTGSAVDHPGGGHPFAGMATQGMAAGGIPFSFMGGAGPFGMPGVQFDMGDILNGLFGGGGSPGPQRRRKMPVGPNKTSDISLKLEQFYKGHSLKLKFNQSRTCTACAGSGAEATDECGSCRGSGGKTVMRQIGPGMIAQTTMPCDACNGDGRRVMKICRGCQGKKLQDKEKELDIQIEPGMTDGQRLVFPGECSDSPDFEKPGDVILTLQCIGMPDTYEWKGSDLHVKTTITYSESVLGFTRTLSDHPADKKPTVSWRGGPLLHGATLKLEGLGMPTAHGTKGALILQIVITPPPLVAWSAEDAAKLQSVLGGAAASFTDVGSFLTFVA